MDLKIVPGPDSDISLLGFNWTCIELRNDSIDIQLSFE
jgi:hypothetical protein